jgi:galactose mutarotase-like enzyme
VPAEPGGGDGTAVVHSFAGEPAITLSSGPTDLTILPEVGLLGASLRHKGLDYLDLPGGAAAAKGGHTTGLPLLAPWANRLGSIAYRAAGRKVDLTDADGLHRDGNGLPIHGTLVGRSGWTVVSLRTQAGSAGLVARFDAGDDPAVMASFPFPHTLTVAVTVTPGRVNVATTLAPSGRRAVPVSFGWHPYFRLPDIGRDHLRVSLPARHRLVLDDRQLPTGEEVAEAAEVVHLADRTFDDGYRLGRDRQLVLAGGRRRVSLVFDKGYPFAQVYAPAGEDFVALEPMTAPTDALSHGSAPVVEPGARFTARFAVSLS